MAAIKLSTNLEQSKKLIELGLDVNTADMHYFSDGYNPTKLNVGYSAENAKFYRGTENEYIPAWSLSALLNIAPKYFSKENHQFVQSYSYDYIDGCYHFIYRDYQHGGRSKYISKNKDLFDAAFEMVIWLKENKKI